MSHVHTYACILICKHVHTHTQHTPIHTHSHTDTQHTHTIVSYSWRPLCLEESSFIVRYGKYELNEHVPQLPFVVLFKCASLTLCMLCTWIAWHNFGDSQLQNFQSVLAGWKFWKVDIVVLGPKCNWKCWQGFHVAALRQNCFLFGKLKTFD